MTDFDELQLAVQHRDLLRASAIKPAVALARGYRSVTNVSEIRDKGFAKGCAVPGLLIPIHGVDGTLRTFQYRPDVPRIDAKGVGRKYEFPFRSRHSLDVPQTIKPLLGDPGVALWITEGARKADAAASIGLACVSLAGVWGWRGTNESGGKVALADWESVALNGRQIFICFDSDVMTNRAVQLAMSRLADFLRHRGAVATPVYLPALDGRKVGLDDYLASHSLDEVMALTSGNRPESPAENAMPSVATTPARPRTLAEVEAVFHRWIPDNDPIPTRVALATYVANQRLDGDPVWTMFVGGSGVGKTERLIPLAAMPDVVLASTLTGQAALLSGSAQKDRAKDASGGLLRRMPSSGGVLVLKDFTSIIDMHRDGRAEVLAALREIHDGRWDRNVGADGGKTLTWTGRLGLIAGCTSVIDSAHGVMSVMGTRFLLVRLAAIPDIAGAAFDHAGHEAQMRQELSEAVRGLLENLPGVSYEKSEIRAAVSALASYVARARSPVDRDHKSEIRQVLDAEAPTRVVKMLVQLWRAAGLLGIRKADAWTMVHRVGMDSIPKLRRVILDHLAEYRNGSNTAEIAGRIRHPVQTTRRALEDLTAHGVVCRFPGGPGVTDSWELSFRALEWLRTAIPVSSVKSQPRSHRSSPPLNKFEITKDDKAGNVVASSQDSDLSNPRPRSSCCLGGPPRLRCGNCRNKPQLWRITKETPQ